MTEILVPIKHALPSKNYHRPFEMIHISDFGKHGKQISTKIWVLK